MKELSIEEKARRYDEAKYIMKEYLESGNAGVIAENTIKKAFPELSESEDEIVIAALISGINGLLKKEYHLKGIGGISFDRIIAWLEKQGEHANFRNKIQVGDKVTRNEAGVLVNISQLSRIAKPRKQGEQKPVEWGTDDLSEFESYLCLMFQKFRTKGVCTNGEIVDFVKEHSQKLKDTLCHVWSEEDKEVINLLLELIYEQDKINPQITSNENRKMMLSWLKSLRPQSQWKPSESDILLLERIANGKSNPQDFQASLYGLIGQLKRLKEK